MASSFKHQYDYYFTIFIAIASPLIRKSYFISFLFVIFRIFFSNKVFFVPDFSFKSLFGFGPVQVGPFIILI